MFKIPVEYLPIACVTLNRKPLLFPLTKKAPMDLTLAARLLDPLVFLPLAHSTSATLISLLSFNHSCPRALGLAPPFARNTLSSDLPITDFFSQFGP